MFHFPDKLLVAWGLLEQLGKPNMDRPIAPETVQAHVLEVFGRHAEELEKNNPDVLGLVPSPGTGEIWIVTDRPASVPTHIEDVPVRVQPAPPVLSPPPGVIVLRPGGVQEPHPEAVTCPPGHPEVRRFRWRFCNPQNDLQTIPAPMRPPIAGIPAAEAEAIFNRHVEELRALPGVSGGGLGANGITIYTDQPGLVPGEIEGIPVKTAPARHFRPVNHTFSATTNPFHGGTAVTDLQIFPPPITAGRIVLSNGKPSCRERPEAVDSGLQATQN